MDWQDLFPKSACGLGGFVLQACLWTGRICSPSLLVDLKDLFPRSTYGLGGLARYFFPHKAGHLFTFGLADPAEQEAVPVERLALLASNLGLTLSGVAQILRRQSSSEDEVQLPHQLTLLSGATQ